MPTKTKLLPSVRVTEGLYGVVRQCAEKQDLNIAELVRLALIDYCSPKQGIPIIGELTTTGITFYQQREEKKEFPYG